MCRRPCCVVRWKCVPTRTREHLQRVVRWKCAFSAARCAREGTRAAMAAACSSSAAPGCVHERCYTTLVFRSNQSVSTSPVQDAMLQLWLRRMRRFTALPIVVMHANVPSPRRLMNATAHRSVESAMLVATLPSPIAVRPGRGRRRSACHTHPGAPDTATPRRPAHRRPAGHAAVVQGAVHEAARVEPAVPAGRVPRPRNRSTCPCARGMCVWMCICI